MKVTFYNKKGLMNTPDIHDHHHEVANAKMVSSNKILALWTENGGLLRVWGEDYQTRIFYLAGATLYVYSDDHYNRKMILQLLDREDPSIRFYNINTK